MPKPRFTYRRQIIPAPPGLKIWTTWDDGTMDEEPWLALAMSFLTYDVSDDAQVDQITQGKAPHTFMDERYYPTNALTEAADDEHFGESDSVYIFLAGDWDSPWTEMGKHGFFTKEAAEEARDKRTKRTSTEG